MAKQHHTGQQGKLIPRGHWEEKSVTMRDETYSFIAC
jgi:hypothetical protein